MKNNPAAARRIRRLHAVLKNETPLRLKEMKGWLRSYSNNYPEDAPKGKSLRTELAEVIQCDADTAAMHTRQAADVLRVAYEWQLTFEFYSELAELEFQAAELESRIQYMKKYNRCAA